MYAVINPESLARAVRDMNRLHQEITSLGVEAANGVASPEDAPRIEQCALMHKELADQLAAYSRAVIRNAIAAEKAKALAQAEAAKKDSEKSVEDTAETESKDNA